MKTRIISLGYSSASLRQGANLPRAEQKSASTQTQRIDLDRPSGSVSPRGRAGWVTVADGGRAGQKSSNFENKIANATSNHGYSDSDITTGLRIFVDQTEVTLTTSGSYTSRADVLSQLATDISTVANVRATWEVNGSRFRIEKEDSLPLNLALGIAGSTTDQNQALITLLNNTTSNVHSSRNTGKHVDTGRIQLESGWSENAVIINGVAIKHYYTDTFDGRIEAINEVSEQTGVKASGQRAHVESTIAFEKSGGAEDFSYKSMSVNGVEITLRQFDPGDSVDEVVTDIVNKLGEHTRSKGALNYLDVYSEGTTIYLDALDLEHGIVIDGGHGADLYLTGKFGGRRFDGPSIRLDAEGDEEIRVSIPSDPSSYTTENQILDSRPGEAALRSSDSLRRLLLKSPETARLYLSHGLLAGEELSEHAGQARRIINGEETLARGPGGVMEFKSTAALERFRLRAATNMARHGYQFAESFQRNKSSVSGFVERAERGNQVFPLYKKAGELESGVAGSHIDEKRTGRLVDQYSLVGIFKDKSSK